MANTKSAQKRNRQMQKRRARNVSVRSGVKGVVKKAREAIEAKDPQKAKDALVAASKSLSKAASKGVLHPKNASRRISRLARAAAAAVQSAK